jgi:hypothetical protein
MSIVNGTLNKKSITAIEVVCCMGNKKRVFVIMPFSKTIEHHTEQYWARHFNSYLKPLIERNENLEAFRSQPLRGDIAGQIITDLVNSDIVVADLTDHNPNVLWELGVRQSYKQCTVTIAETGTQIPFHFSHKGILFYNGEHLDNQEFETSFLGALTNCVESPNDVDSPVLGALGGRGTLYSIIHAQENARRIQALQIEIGFNNTDINQIYEFCEQNEKLRTENKIEKCQMSSSLLRSSAIEFLYVNRYLDLDQDFYTSVDSYCKHIGSINSGLNEWRSHPQEVEKWLILNKLGFNEVTAKLKEYLEKATGS